MAYTDKFQKIANEARSRVDDVRPDQIDAFLRAGAVLLDIRDKEEHDAGHIPGSLHISRGKLEMQIEGVIADLNTIIICYCNAYNRGALSADTLRSMGYERAKFLAGGFNVFNEQCPQ